MFRRHEIRPGHRSFLAQIPSLCSVYPQNEQYQFKHLTTKQGLPSNRINDIIKDKKGFMWFATDNGLARYDVGQSGWEEVDVVPLDAAGTNFGWPVVEGFECFEG